MRYLIAFSLSDTVTSTLAQVYEQVFNQPLPVKWLHLTLVSPFTINHEADSPEPRLPLTHALGQINSIYTQPTYRFALPAVFTQKGKTLLHLPVLPREPLIITHDQLVINLADHVTFDLTPYDINALPAFFPHVTLDYDLTHSLNQLDQNVTSMAVEGLSFTLSTPALYCETTPTNWEII